MWKDEVVSILRYLISDFESPYRYVDDRLSDVVLISAHLLSRELNTDYTVTINSCSISPDPTSDIQFLNLLALKSACILYNSEAKTAQSQAIVVKDGPASIDTSKRVDTIIRLAQDACKAFQHAKINYLLGEGSAGQIITTPITVEYKGQ